MCDSVSSVCLCCVYYVYVYTCVSGGVVHVWCMYIFVCTYLFVLCVYICMLYVIFVCVNCTYIFVYCMCVVCIYLYVCCRYIFVLCYVCIFVCVVCVYACIFGSWAASSLFALWHALLPYQRPQWARTETSKTVLPKNYFLSVDSVEYLLNIRTLTH